jgi:RNA polymerase sigma-70 factor (ECF subfamily)
MTELAGRSDEDLLRRMGSGDEEAFGALYQRRQGAVYRFALQMSGSTSVAEEVTQEVFLALIRGDGRFDAGRGSLASWLYGAARNQVLKLVERDRRYEPIDEQALDREDGSAGTLDELTRGEALDALRAAVLGLPPRYREVVVLCDLEEMSYDDAARVLQCATGTVRSRLHRGRALLAGKLRTMRCGV